MTVMSSEHPGRAVRRTGRTGGRRGLAAGLGLVAVASVGLSGAWYAASAGVVTKSAADRSHRVAVVEYDLGDTVFTPPHARDSGPAELAAVVHYPQDVAVGEHPLIVIEHGYWISCADRQAQADLEAAEKAGDDAARSRASTRLSHWPCANRIPLPNNRGYDYLGTELAGHGFVVVSIAANGINSNEVQNDAADNGYAARADLINEHLAMWQKLASTGAGKLRGKLVDPATGRPSNVDFRGHVDLTNVGTIGHSRGGKGVMWQAADKHRAEWPPGVQVKAVAPFAPVHFDIVEGDASDGLVTTMPIAEVGGTCDTVVVGGGGSYVADARGKNRAPIYHFTVHGANHNFFNTEWSPLSGQVGAYDDFTRFFPGAPAGRCGFTGSKPNGADAQLTEQAQRRVATTYLSAFFRRHLLGDKSFDPILDGTTHPLSGVAQVDVVALPPVS
jgi:hypothetical protein